MLVKSCVSVWFYNFKKLSLPSSPLLFLSYEVAPRSDSEESDSDYEEEVCKYLRWRVTVLKIDGKLLPKHRAHLQVLVHLVLKGWLLIKTGTKGLQNL